MWIPTPSVYTLAENGIFLPVEHSRQKIESSHVTLMTDIGIRHSQVTLLVEIGTPPPNVSRDWDPSPSV